MVEQIAELKVTVVKGESEVNQGRVIEDKPKFIVKIHMVIYFVVVFILLGCGWLQLRKEVLIFVVHAFDLNFPQVLLLNKTLPGVLKLFTPYLKLVYLFEQLYQFFEVERMLFEAKLFDVVHSLARKLVEINCFVIQVDFHVFHEIHALK